MHESEDQYQLCQHTERNKGLYTADQRINRNDQRGTRQNPNGNRRGLECPEERDYYPWWHPSPWIGTFCLLCFVIIGAFSCSMVRVRSCPVSPGMQLQLHPNFSLIFRPVPMIFFFQISPC